jgi:putative aldouronate transport system permease protein
MASFSEPANVLSNIGLYWRPLGFSLDGYKVVFNNPNIINGYINTTINLVIGTSFCMLMTTIGAYALSRRNLYFKRIITFFVVFTMYFGGGLIPTYLVVKGVGLYNSRWALILPSAISTWNLIVLKTGFQRVPLSLNESAVIDGANDFTILFRIMIPVSKATIAVITLFYAVSYWNSWFAASIYLRERKLYPLQLVLREILISNTVANTSGVIDANMSESSLMGELIRYCSIIVSTVPILCIYPFVQKYFVKGIMMGSIKG